MDARSADSNGIHMTCSQSRAPRRISSGEAGLSAVRPSHAADCQSDPLGGAAPMANGIRKAPLARISRKAHFHDCSQTIHKANEECLLTRHCPKVRQTARVGPVVRGDADG